MISLKSSADELLQRQFTLRIRQQPEQARLSTGNERGDWRVKSHLDNVKMNMLIQSI
jgi:hypothetical protein